MKRVPYEVMVNEFERVLTKYGFEPNDAKASAELFAQNSMAGVYSHGLNRFPRVVDYLKKDGRTNTSAIVPADAAANDKEAKLSKLEYEVISYDEVKDITHVRIHLITGRHHQIRVQFASRRNPLVGDYKYATADCGMDNAVKAVAFKRNQIALCAVSLTVDNKTYSVAPEFSIG